jgi:hypothetical protein
LYSTRWWVSFLRECTNKCTNFLWIQDTFVLNMATIKHSFGNIYFLNMDILSVHMIQNMNYYISFRTQHTASFASFLDLYLEFDDSGQRSTKLYVKRDDFNFKIINFPNVCSNIPASPAYGVYISQLIRYTRASRNYSDFLKRHLHLRNRLLDQGY